MKRRGFLRGTVAISAVGTAGLAGCLERLGFNEESAWANPPLVENRPDAVYLPASREEMGTYGTATDGDYAAALSYTFPHRFWIVESTSEEKSLVEVDTDDSLHLMATVWDRETHTVLPANMRFEISQDGDPVDAGTSSPWPMISQRMGFHYGDNVQLPGEGEYTVRITVSPLSGIERIGAFEGRFESSGSLEIDFEYARSDLHDLSFTTIDEERRGSREALPLMDHGDHGGDGGHNGDVGDGNGGHGDGAGQPPMGQGVAIEELPGEVLEPQQSGDATFVALVSDAERFTDGGTYLAISPRTPYNGIVLPFTSLSASVDGNGSVRSEGPAETLDHEIGHHYGVAVDDLASGDRVTISVDSPPQVSRHDGYETAFFDFDDLTYTV
ncbi:iron transporter [Natrinema zhouii]|uniref:Iron transporter n=1 Tax=Natrinema zhouii TaxID=1710539 RepID=A0A7D6CQU1_9EURY|nr:iron transporter [Natrinema zhouii]QLK26754.1 iron transporter [Natrinema zhouii]